MKKTIFGMMILLQCVLLVQPAFADWPVFRGDAALQGISDGKLGSNPELAWSIKVGDADLSSPVTDGRNVFVSSAEGGIFALSLKDGKQVWSRKVEASVKAAPLFLNGRLFVGARDGTMYALAASNGEVIWQYKAGDQIMRSANWTAGTETNIVFACYDNNVYCIDWTGGALKWKHETENFVNGTPAVAGGEVVFGGCDQYLRIVDSGAGREKFKVDVGSYIAESAAVAGNDVFVGHYGGKLVHVDLKKRKIIWEYESEEKEPFFSSPAVTADRVLVGSRDNNLHCVERSTGRRLWVFRTSGKVDSSPVVAGDKAAAGSSDGRLYLLGAATGKEIARYDTGSAIRTSPAIIGNMVIVATEGGSILAIRFSKK
ncbi:MAG: PQQ-binding-like beta-propeller repeat protein [Verrucomicrobiota bacterium]